MCIQMVKWVITQNPTLAPVVQKSKYEPKAQGADVSVSSDTLKDATTFLETFFKLYPTATEKELAYYVKDGVLAPVSGDYVFSELVNPVFTKYRPCEAQAHTVRFVSVCP